MNVFMSPSPTGSQQSMTDISLEQAMEKVQELATENATLREYLKENNENMKKQFQMLLQWKEKVRESNKQNLLRFEQLHRQINILRLENEKYKQCLESPDKQGSVLEELQAHVRRLEEEKMSTEYEIVELRKKVENLKSELNKSPDAETVFVNTETDLSELEGYKTRCAELAGQVHNFHQQNEQLMQDIQQITTLKVQIQNENAVLNEQNLVLQKQLQGLFGDINKTKYSVGGTQATNKETVRTNNYSVCQNDELKETESSVTSRADIELLALQTAAVERLNSAEEVASGVAEELKEKLQEEKIINSKQKQQLSSKEIEISRLQSELNEREQMLGHYKEQQDLQIAHMTQEHKRQQQDLLRQLDMLNNELNQTKSSLPYMGDVQNLKSQVMSLIKESQELSAKLDMSTKALEKKSTRVLELEKHISRREEEFVQSRRDMDSIVQQLKFSLSTSDDTINRERGEHATTKKQLIELRASFNQLVNDYKELLDTFDEYKASQLHQQQPGGQSKQLMDDINRLTAQTIAAEEAITYRDDQIKQLKSENARLKDEIDNTIPVLKAQADLWRQDFDAERNARERQVAEKETILQEMRNLELKNQQLIDELESYSRKSLAEMQRRHATPTYQQQLQSHLQQGNQGGAIGYYPGPQVTSPSSYQTQHTPPRGSGYQYGGNMGYSSQQPVEHGTDDGDATKPVNPPQLSQPHSNSSAGSHQEEGDNQLSCPKCGVVCPDLDSLQIHVLDCLDN